MKSFTFAGTRINLHPSWSDLFTPELKYLLKNIEEQVGKDFVPDPKDAFQFLSLDLKKIKIIMLCPPPFEDDHQATGRPFELKGRGSWFNSINHFELRKLLKQIYEAYQDENTNLRKVRSAIAIGSFDILPPSKLSAWWEKQGVLMLYSSLTTEKGKKAAHHTLWKPFMFSLLNFLNKKLSTATWMAFGNKANEIAEMAGLPLSHSPEENPIKANLKKLNWKGI